MMEDCVAKLSQEIKCRDSLIETLYSFLADDILFQSIFVYGHISCGKSIVVQKVLEYLKYNYSIINCIEHITHRSMFEKIILDLLSIDLDASNGYKLEKRCDDFVEFISQIKLISQKDSKPIVIVLENCDRLRESEQNILPALLRLGELTKSNVCTIFISDVIWEKFKPKVIGLYEPLKIHFPQYTNSEMLEILLHLTNSHNYSQNFHEKYLSLFLSVYLRYCRDLRELRYMANKNFEKYIEPVKSNSINENDLKALWRNVLPTFQTNLEVIYLRVSANDFEQQNKLTEIESTTKLALSFELPLYAKYLLIAAYLASYNPVTEDKRLFLAGVGQKKKKYRKSMKPKVLTTCTGPRSFPLRRLLSIFSIIVNVNVDLNAILLMQIPSMCQLGLISVVGDNNIDEPKYKCCISLEFAMVISKNIDFELKKYLYDFL